MRRLLLGLLRLFFGPCEHAQAGSLTAEHHPFRKRLADSGLRFPDRPVYPTRPLVFDDSELVRQPRDNGDLVG
jgi:hypothetical protein